MGGSAFRTAGTVTGRHARIQHVVCVDVPARRHRIGETLPFEGVPNSWLGTRSPVTLSVTSCSLVDIVRPPGCRTAN